MFRKEETFAAVHLLCRRNFDGCENGEVALAAFMEDILKDKKNIGAKSVTLILLNADGVMDKSPYPADDTFTNLCEEYLTQVRSSA